MQQLEDAVIEEWNAIPQAFIANIVQSMRHRCVALINARGGFTWYWGFESKIKGGNILTLKEVVTIIGYVKML